MILVCSLVCSPNAEMLERKKLLLNQIHFWKWSINDVNVFKSFFWNLNGFMKKKLQVFFIVYLNQI